MRTGIRTYVALAAAGALAVAAGTVALATPPKGEAGKPITRGTLIAPANVSEKLPGGAHVTIKTQGALDAFMLNITLAPGGNGGWHEHAGPRVEIVDKGTLTVVDNKCKRHAISAGQAYIAPGSSVVKDENRSSKPVSFFVTFLLPSSAGSPRIDEPAPAGCKA
jgi:quercetin dioxygenase-like cupin family protein